MRANNIIIFGAGGHAKSVISIIEAEAKWKIEALFVPPEHASVADSILGYPVITGSIQNLPQSTQGIVAIGDNDARSQVSKSLQKHGIQLVSTIHPKAVLARDVKIGAGSIVHALSVVGPNVSIGRNAIISAMVTIGHDSKIANNAHLTPGVHLGGEASVGHSTFIGMGAVIFPKVTIGENVRIGANSVIRKDVKSNSLVIDKSTRIVTSSD